MPHGWRRPPMANGRWQSCAPRLDETFPVGRTSVPLWPHSLSGASPTWVLDADEAYVPRQTGRGSQVLAATIAVGTCSGLLLGDGSWALLRSRHRRAEGSAAVVRHRHLNHSWLCCDLGAWHHQGHDRRLCVVRQALPPSSGSQESGSGRNRTAASGLVVTMNSSLILGSRCSCLM